MAGSERSGQRCPEKCLFWNGKAFLCFPAASLIALHCSFLDKMRVESDDKIVLISNYTETLDVIERLLDAKR